jgi:hypothetical protein
MRTVFIGIQYTSMVIAVVSLLVLMFTFGHTETLPVGTSALFFGLAILFSCITGVLHWIGLPPEETEGDEKATK